MRVTLLPLYGLYTVLPRTTGIEITQIKKKLHTKFYFYKYCIIYVYYVNIKIIYLYTYLK